MKKEISVVDSELKAAMLCKCPKCRTGNMFATAPPAIFRQSIHQRCPHCGFYFEVIPDYFFVARSLSLLLNIVIVALVLISVYVITGSSNLWPYILAPLISLIILSPFVYRYSRILLLYRMTPGVDFEPKHAKYRYRESDI